jgi:hypothetical protein
MSTQNIFLITLITFLNQSLTSKNTKNMSKTQNQPGNEFHPDLGSGIFKVKKHLS